MKLPRIDRALVDCENHLHSTASFNTEIESLLTYSLLVVIYAEFEQMVNVIVQEKCNSIEDEALRELAKSCIGSVSRIQSSQMGDMLERFGAGRKAAFRNEITANQGRQRAETFYNNLITNRHDTAHSIGSNLTFGEVKRYYQEGHVVLPAKAGIHNSWSPAIFEADGANRTTLQSSCQEGHVVLDFFRQALLATGTA